MEAEAEVEVLTSGPIHEAFAQPVLLNPQSGLVVAAAPPPDVEEQPPEMRPEEEAVWIPGYWAWDDSTEDFIWVSGVWRRPPPGFVWVPGYWNQVVDGYQWVSGFWTAAEANEVEYLPEPPPESLDLGPSSPPPGEGYFWVPGHWVWVQGRYIWQPGYWALAQSDWVWNAAHYTWTPGGCVYVPGYWDYPLLRRGWLFAPLRLAAAGVRAGLYVAPRAILRAALLPLHLFVRPGYGHYYFGNYYGPRWAHWGFYPWYTFGDWRRGYDPLYWHFGAHYRGGYAGWHNALRDRYRYYQSREELRPPRTWGEQSLALERAGSRARDELRVAERLDRAVASGPDALRGRALGEAQRRQFAESGQKLREFSRERAALESQGAGQRGGRGRVEGDQPDQRSQARLRLPELPGSSSRASRAPSAQAGGPGRGTRGEGPELRGEVGARGRAGADRAGDRGEAPGARVDGGLRAQGEAGGGNAAARRIQAAPPGVSRGGSFDRNAGRPAPGQVQRPANRSSPGRLPEFRQPNSRPPASARSRSGFGGAQGPANVRQRSPRQSSPRSSAGPTQSFGGGRSFGAAPARGGPSRQAGPSMRPGGGPSFAPRSGGSSFSPRGGGGPSFSPRGGGGGGGFRGGEGGGFGGGGGGGGARGGGRGR